jgi:hypothetical protein
VCNNRETSESNKAPSQLIRWNLGRRQWKMTMDNRRTQISEPSPSNVEKRKRTVLETSLDKLESVKMEDEVKNVLMTIINLVIKYVDAKAMARNLRKAVELHERHYNKINWESTN